MQKHNVSLKPAIVTANNADVSMNGVQYLYLAVEDLMCWRLEMSYRVRDEFLAVLSAVKNEGLDLAVVTVNPGINGAFLSKNKLFGSIELIRPDRIELKEPHSEEKSEIVIDSGVVSAKENHVIYPILWCKRITANAGVCLKCAVIMLVISGLLLLSLTVTGLFTRLSSAIVTVLCLIMQIPSAMSALFIKSIPEAPTTKSTTKKK